MCISVCAWSSDSNNNHDNLNNAVKVIATKIVSPFCPTLLSTRFASSHTHTLAQKRTHTEAHDHTDRKSPVSVCAIHPS